MEYDLSPCYGCVDRIVGCHCYCKKYIDYSENRKLICQERETACKSKFFPNQKFVKAMRKQFKKNK